MLRRDLIATLLALLPGGFASLFEDLQTLVTGDETAGDTRDDANEPGDGTGESSDGTDDETDGETDDALGDRDEPTTDTRTAVVDRIEDDTAVLLFEDEGTQETVEASVLPEAAREAGVVIRVPDGDSLALATVDRAETAERREDAQDRFDELAEPVPDPNESDGSTNRTGS